MSQLRHALARKLFLELIDAPASEREMRLLRVASDDAALAGEVRDLLAADGEADGFLETPVVPRATLEATIEESPSESVVPSALGEFRIVGVLGSGGMGIVYLAEHDHPPRRVALKLLKPHLGSRQSLRRFHHEAEALGRLSHPGIARIFSTGTLSTAVGPQPFLAMELVEGAPLLDWAREHAPSPERRLELIATIADAVEHAHQRGVIHRDLKPANILVDPSGQPRILDFGVARLTAHQEATSCETRTGQLVGTLPYMSPEQVSGAPEQVDTRTDVYALGAIAFEMLTGRLPIDVADKPLPEAAHLISSQEPDRVSTFDRRLGGDVDVIVATALAKEKERRYGSAFALAHDIRRHLRHEPILARTPSRLYLLTKFARRHRGAVIGVAAVFLALVLGIAATSWQAIEAIAARTLAEERERAATAARAAAAAESRRQAMIVRFIVDMFASTQPDVAKGKDPTIREFMVRASSDPTQTFGNDRLFEATMRHIFADVFWGWHDDANSVAQARQALEIRTTELGADHADTLESECLLALSIMSTDSAAARKHLEHVLEVERRRADPTPASLLALSNNLALVLEDQGDFEAAERASRATAETCDARPDVPLVNRATAWTTLAGILERRGKLAEAEQILRRNLDEAQRELGKDHTLSITIANNLGGLLARSGRSDDALKMLESALALERRVLPADHPDTATTLNVLGALYVRRRDPASARRSFAEALSMRERLFGVTDFRTIAVVDSLASLEVGAGRPEAAAPHLARLWAAREASAAQGSPEAIGIAFAYGACLLQSNRSGDAIGVLRAGFDAERAKSPTATRVANFRRLLELAYARQDRIPDLLALLREESDAIDARFGEGDERAIERRLAVADAELGAGQLAGNDEGLAERVRIAEATLGRHHDLVAWGKELQAFALQRERRSKRAEALFREALAIRESRDDAPIRAAWLRGQLFLLGRAQGNVFPAADFAAGFWGTLMSFARQPLQSATEIVRVLSRSKFGENHATRR